MSQLNSSRILNTQGKQPAASATSVGGRLAMLAINFIPCLLSATLLTLLLIPYDTPGRRFLYAAATLYLVPPLLASLIRRLFPLKEGTLAAGSPEFLTWWAVFNLQVIFCRLPFLEELLRLAPGFYSAWLRLWGSRVGRLTYWAPGTTILDRSFVRIGDDVIFGAGVRLNPHVMMVNEAGEKEVLLATVSIGSNAVVGGYSLLTAGTEIAQGELVRAYLISPPHSRWEGGRRVKGAAASPAD